MISGNLAKPLENGLSNVLRTHPGEPEIDRQTGRNDIWKERAEPLLQTKIGEVPEIIDASSQAEKGRRGGLDVNPAVLKKNIVGYCDSLSGRPGGLAKKGDRLGCPGKEEGNLSLQPVIFFIHDRSKLEGGPSGLLGAKSIKDLSALSGLEPELTLRYRVGHPDARSRCFENNTPFAWRKIVDENPPFEGVAHSGKTGEGGLEQERLRDTEGRLLSAEPRIFGLGDRHDTESRQVVRQLEGHFGLTGIIRGQSRIPIGRGAKIPPQFHFGQPALEDCGLALAAPADILTLFSILPLPDNMDPRLRGPDGKGALSVKL